MPRYPTEYCIIKTENSFCPECKKPVALLTPQSSERKPKFYICFGCQFVAEVGVGKIELHE